MFEERKDGKKSGAFIWIAPPKNDLQDRKMGCYLEQQKNSCHTTGTEYATS